MEVSALRVNQSSGTNYSKNSATNYCSYKNELCADTVSFSGKKKAECIEPATKKSSTGHKLLVSATNLLIPGLGQAINGQWGKAALFAFGAPVAAFAASMVSFPLAIGVGAVAEVAMFVDAYKNA